MSDDSSAKLESLKQSANALATAHQLLNFGTFQGAHAKDVLNSIAFIEEFHKQVTEQIGALEPKQEQSVVEQAPANRAQRRSKKSKTENAQVKS